MSEEASMCAGAEFYWQTVSGGWLYIIVLAWHVIWCAAARPKMRSR